MLFRIRIYLAAVLLPLLLCNWSGWTGLGGWHCADGSQCRPAASATCCCGSGATDVRDSDRHLQVSARCGCYYEAQTLEARLQPAALEVHFTALPPPHHALELSAAGTRVDHVPPPAPDPPPIFGSPPVTRGPPSV